MEEKRHTLYTDKMEFHIIELPKLPEKLKEENHMILLWAKFINAERKEEFEMLAEKNTYINHAYQQLQVVSQDKEKRLEYEAREKAIRDYNQLMFEAKQNGWKEGRKEGREEGIQVMIFDNLEEGISKEKILKKLQKRFSLTAEKAANYYEKFAENDYSTKNISNQN